MGNPMPKLTTTPGSKLTLAPISHKKLGLGSTCGMDGKIKAVALTSVEQQQAFFTLEQLDEG
jgi:hypothetical protein